MNNCDVREIPENVKSIVGRLGNVISYLIHYLHKWEEMAGFLLWGMHFISYLPEIVLGQMEFGWVECLLA